MTPTARRITVNGKIKIEVTLPDGTSHRYGGKVAERAHAALFAAWPSSTDVSWNGFRADLAKAEAEAASWLKPPRRGAQFRNVAITAYAIPIED